MENGNRLDCAALRNMDMIDYLAAIGIMACKIRGNDFWYLSPFRAERTASFKVNRKLNRWYDFGEGRGGNLIDFALRYYDCSIAELLRMSRTDLSMLRPHQPPAPQGSMQQSSLRILETASIRSWPLLHYLRYRRIPVDIADQYCREVKFLMNGKHLYGIGFPNDSRAAMYHNYNDLNDWHCGKRRPP